MMLHGLGDCTPEFNCGCMDYEPTEVEVERAARAVWRWFVGDSLGGFDKHVYAYDREKCMDAARAALRAARGLA